MFKLARAEPGSSHGEPVMSGTNLNRLYDPLIAIPSAAVLDPAILPGIRSAVVGLRPGGDTRGHGSGDEPPGGGGTGIAPITVAAPVAIRPAAVPAMALPRIVAARMARSRRHGIKRSEGKGKGKGKEYSQREYSYLPSSQSGHNKLPGV
jgi:hypothetical protein